MKSTRRSKLFDKSAFAHLGDPNLYRYVGNNVVNLIDPTGLWGQPIGGGSSSNNFGPGGFSLITSADIDRIMGTSPDINASNNYGVSLQMNVSLNSRPQDISLVNVPTWVATWQSSAFDSNNPFDFVKPSSSLPQGIFSDSQFVNQFAGFVGTFSQPTTSHMGLSVLVDPDPSSLSWLNYTPSNPNYYVPPATQTQINNPNQPIVTLGYALGTPTYNLGGGSAQNIALTNFEAGLQIATGALQLAGGSAFAWSTAPTVVGAVAGVGVAARGMDNIQAGLNTLFTGQSSPTLLNQAVTHVTGSPTAGFVADVTADLATVRPTGQGLNTLVPAARSTHVAPRATVPVNAPSSLPKYASEVTTGRYLAGEAPRQVAPGTRVLTGQYIESSGVAPRVQPWTAHYDEFGRLIGRTDYNAANPVMRIPDTHYHIWEYNSQFPLGRQNPIHFPGEF